MNVHSRETRGGLRRWVDLLVFTCDRINRHNGRDAYAERLLTEQALPHAMQRVIRWEDAIAQGRSPCWTRSDERRVLMQQGLGGAGFRPRCRVERLAQRLRPIRDHRFRLAIDETVRYGTASVLAPKLDASKVVLNELLELAVKQHVHRSRARMQQLNDREFLREYQETEERLMESAAELLNWCSPRSANIQASAFTSNTEQAPSRGGRPRLDDTVLAGLLQEYEQGKDAGLWKYQCDFATRKGVKPQTMSNQLKKARANRQAVEKSDKPSG